MRDKPRAMGDVSARLTHWRNLQVRDEFQSVFDQLLGHIRQNDGERSRETEALYAHLSRSGSQASSGRKGGRERQAPGGAIMRESSGSLAESPMAPGNTSRSDRESATNVKKSLTTIIREHMKIVITYDENCRALNGLFDKVRHDTEFEMSLDLVSMMRCLTSSEFTMDDTVRADLAFEGSKTLYALVYKVIENWKMKELTVKDPINRFSRAYCGILNSSTAFRRQCQCQRVEYGSPVDEQLVEPISSGRSPGAGGETRDKVRPLSCYVYREPGSRLYRKAIVQLL